VQRAVEAEQEQASVGTAHAIFSMAERGHAAAQRLASSFLDALGTGLASALNVLDLELVVLAGGISPGVLARIDDVRSAMGQSLFARSIDEVRIVGASKGPFAGAIGAARLGLLACEHDPASR
jgi:glucokinase